MIILISKNNSWSRNLYNELCNRKIDVTWLTEYTLVQLEEYKPEFVIFFHWSDYISEKVFSKLKCISTHTSNLPNGKGGSPLQNQILDGIVESKVNLIETSKEIDGGGIYCSNPITLQGTIDDIWHTIASVTSNLVCKLVKNKLKPVKQESGSKIYKRRKTSELIFDYSKDISYLYKQIQMLDSEEYPRACLEINGFKLEFSRASLTANNILTDVKISKK